MMFMAVMLFFLKEPLIVFLWVLWELIFWMSDLQGKLFQKKIYKSYIK
jgi:hypothetical protein